MSRVPVLAAGTLAVLAAPVVLVALAIAGAAPTEPTATCQAVGVADGQADTSTHESGDMLDVTIASGEDTSCQLASEAACPPTGHPAERELTPDALLVLRCIATHFPQVVDFHGVGDRPNHSDHPTGHAVDAMIPAWMTHAGNTVGWDVADWVRANHVCLGVTYIIWDGRVWSTDRDRSGWRPYRHPNGWTDANSLHHNHVHVSVEGNAGSDACAGDAWVVPLRGDYTITARFGDSGPRWSHTHTGVDLAAPYGREVLAASRGQVGHAGWDGPYGLKVELLHEDGSRTWYAHLSALAVASGEPVTAGQVIGQVGATGNATGPHLHYEIRSADSRAIDPEAWMTARGVAL